VIVLEGQDVICFLLRNGLSNLFLTPHRINQQNLENLRRNHYAPNVMCETNVPSSPRSKAMRPLKSHFPDHALAT
jgi:hypothetical protein